jgi:hypothetical protein
VVGPNSTMRGSSFLGQQPTMAEQISPNEAARRRSLRSRQSSPVPGFSALLGTLRARQADAAAATGVAEFRWEVNSGRLAAHEVTVYPSFPILDLLAYDRDLGSRYVCGADEAGRAGWAGPLCRRPCPVRL